MRTTVVIGASENPERFSFRAVKKLRQNNISVAAVGLKEGKIDDVKIQTGFPKIENVDTVTLYVGPKNQPAYYNYILELKPERIIFNPGTENPELEEKVRAAGIEVLEACTLTMLSVGTYK
jgi:predicted CoA-binding protein